MADKFKTSNYIEMVQSLAPEIAACDALNLDLAKLPSLDWVAVLSDEVPDGFIRYAKLMEMADAARREEAANIEATLDCDEAIHIQFTSGTTGFPKGATLTHRNILNNGYNVVTRQNFTSADRLCIPVPLYHCFGMVMGVLGCITHGAAMVFPDEAFDPESVMKAVQAENCTALYGVPTMFIAELALSGLGRYDLSTQRTGVMAGSPCPIDTMKKVIDVMNMHDVTICYGMTETSPVSTQTKPQDSIERKVSTVGSVHPHVEVKIIDERGNTLPRGERGELCTRGYSVMLGYWDDEARTREAIDSEGWMHTGDLATMDEGGFVNITGRVKDMIIRGGENIYPREIEEYLYRNPKIRDVQVFGVPDEKYGEEVCAWIVLQDQMEMDEIEVIEFCKGQIAHFKIPRHIRFVDSFPMTVTGKIQKFVMREEMAERLNRIEAETA